MKEWRKLYKIDLEIQSKKEVIETLKSSMYTLQAVKYKDKVQGGDISADKMLIERIYKLEQLEKELNELITLKFNYIEKIDLIEDPEQKAVLRYRYVMGLVWEAIAVKIGCSRTQIFRLHKKALINLKNNLKKK